MPITADINPGEHWLIAGKGLFVFEQEEVNCILRFRRDGTSFAYRMPEHEFWDRVNKNRIEGVFFDKKGDPIEREEVSPGEVWTIDDVEKMKLTPETAQLTYKADAFSPADLHEDPTFGWFLGYISSENEVPDDDPLLNTTLWRDIDETPWWAGRASR